MQNVSYFKIGLRTSWVTKGIYVEGLEGRVYVGPTY